MEKSASDVIFDKLLGNTLFLILCPVVCIAIGLFVFILPEFDNQPVTRAEAKTVSGSFEKYEVFGNYRDLYFSDGTSYPVFPHTESAEFQKQMKAMEPGTHLTIAVHPKSGFVIEVRTDTEELMEFETAQQEIRRYGIGYICLGGVFFLLSIFISVYGFWQKAAAKKEEERQHRQLARTKTNADGNFTPPLRDAATTGKARVFLQTKRKGCSIQYRRLKEVNELVVNGKVYDEMKARIEFAHNLRAMVDGHCIEAGMEDGHSCNFCYIRFDGMTIARKKRYF